MSSSIESTGPTRRELVRRGFAVSGALAATATLPALIGARAASAKLPDDDVGIVAALLTLEQRAVLVYESAARGGKLRSVPNAAANRFRRHEQEHADALAAALRELGGSAPQPPSSADDVDGLSDALATEKELLDFAIGFETTVVATYNEAISKLKDGRLLQTVASIVAGQGQHLVVLRQAAGRDPLPNALESGRDE